MWRVSEGNVDKPSGRVRQCPIWSFPIETTLVCTFRPIRRGPAMLSAFPSFQPRLVATGDQLESLAPYFVHSMYSLCPINVNEPLLNAAQAYDVHATKFAPSHRYSDSRWNLCDPLHRSKMKQKQINIFVVPKASQCKPTCSLLVKWRFCSSIDAKLVVKLFFSICAEWRNFSSSSWLQKLYSGCAAVIKYNNSFD